MKGRTRKSSKLRAERPTSKSRRPRRASLHFFGLRNSTSENEMSNSLTVGNMCHFVLGRGRTNMTSYVILSLMMIHTVKKKVLFLSHYIITGAAHPGVFRGKFPVSAPLLLSSLLFFAQVPLYIIHTISPCTFAPWS